MTERRQLDVITGPASTEPCCLPGLCDYCPMLVAKILGVIQGARSRGEDLTAREAESRPSGDSLGRAPGVSTSLDIRFLRRIWDIERAQREGAVTAEEISRKLCPYSLDACTHLDDEGDRGA